MSYVSKSTFGDLTKSAKEAAAKKGLVKMDQQQQQQQHILQHQQQQQQQQIPGNQGTSLVSTNSGGLIAGTGRDFFSSFSNEITSITTSTSTMFSDLFGKSNKTNDYKIY